MEQLIHGKPMEYWKENAEEDYMTTPISVLKYITVLEEQSKWIKVSERLPENFQQVLCVTNIGRNVDSNPVRYEVVSKFIKNI